MQKPFSQAKFGEKKTRFQQYIKFATSTKVELLLNQLVDIELVTTKKLKIDKECRKSYVNYNCPDREFDAVDENSNKQITL